MPGGSARARVASPRGAGASDPPVPTLVPNSAQNIVDSEIRYRRLFEAAKDGILILDAATGQITDANPFLLSMLGYEHAELLGRTLWKIGPFKDIVASRAAFRQLQAREYVRYEHLPLETKGQERRHVEFISNVYLAAGTRVIQCNIRDITERKAAEERTRQTNAELLSLVKELQRREREMRLLSERLREQANHDPLTGLFNRRYLDDSLARELSLSQRRSAPLSVAILDLDHFKRLNDAFGHDAGDLALRHCAHVLAQNLRRSDIACRLGGDEFALVMPDSSLADTRLRVEALCRLVKKLELRHNGQLLGRMTFSAGIAGCLEHATTAREILRAADLALYAAKRAGRGRVVLHTLSETPPDA